MQKGECFFVRFFVLRLLALKVTMLRLVRVKTYIFDCVSLERTHMVYFATMHKMTF